MAILVMISTVPIQTKAGLSAAEPRDNTFQLLLLPVQCLSPILVLLLIYLYLLLLPLLCTCFILSLHAHCIFSTALCSQNLATALQKYFTTAPNPNPPSLSPSSLAFALDFYLTSDPAFSPAFSPVSFLSYPAIAHGRFLHWLI